MNTFMPMFRFGFDLRPSAKSEGTDVRSSCPPRNATFGQLDLACAHRLDLPCAAHWCRGLDRLGGGVDPRQLERQNEDIEVLRLLVLGRFHGTIGCALRGRGCRGAFLPGRYPA